jgi:hypothetical protein
LKVGVVVRTMFSRLLAFTDAITGFETPFAVNTALEALQIAKELIAVVL